MCISLSCHRSLVILTTQVRLDSRRCAELALAAPVRYRVPAARPALAAALADSASPLRPRGFLGSPLGIVPGSPPWVRLLVRRRARLGTFHTAAPPAASAP